MNLSSLGSNPVLAAIPVNLLALQAPSASAIHQSRAHKPLAEVGGVRGTAEKNYDRGSVFMALHFSAARGHSRELLPYCFESDVLRVLR